MTQGVALFCKLSRCKKTCSWSQNPKRPCPPEEHSCTAWIDSEAILESNPPQRNLRLSLKNDELCQAFITKEITFDIDILQVDGNNVLLNLINSGDQILYEY